MRQNLTTGSTYWNWHVLDCFCCFGGNVLGYSQMSDCSTQVKVDSFPIWIKRIISEGSVSSGICQICTSVIPHMQKSIYSHYSPGFISLMWQMWMYNYLPLRVDGNWLSAPMLWLEISYGWCRSLWMAGKSKRYLWELNLDKRASPKRFCPAEIAPSYVETEEG